MQIPRRLPFPAVVMTEFFTNSELDGDVKHLAVYDGRHKLVSWRVLQAGPGDYCRIAFQTMPKQHLYKIYYGRKSETTKAPSWTSSAGLLLETRRWANCDLNSLGSIHEAWQSSEPYGSAFVPAVFHRFNPFWPAPEPFLSEYRGTLHISRPGLYRFFTSSQDASFLSIDGVQVVSAPGWHGPVGDARFKGEVNLSSGSHAFQYLHAAAGTDACMVAAWEPPGSQKPELIPSEAFDSQAIARLPAVGIKHPREYAVDVVGEVPLAESDLPMIRAQFKFVTAQASTSRPRLHWDFGDGQTGTQTDPIHIYLHPGLYTATMTVAGESEKLAVVNRVPVNRALVFSSETEPADDLASYLAIIARYDPAKLDTTGLLQLVKAFDQAGLAPRAAKAGQAGILGRPAVDSESGLAVVRMVGELLRDKLDDPEGAFHFWQKASKVVEPGPWKAECEIEAADIALDALLQAGPAKALLDSATACLKQGGQASLTSRLHRVWGDWYARKGDKPSGRTAYLRAMAPLETRRPHAETEALHGALSRSTEEFLRDHSLGRARSELARWQEAFPVNKIEGYLTFLQASYCTARGKYAQAIAKADDLLAINPDSPYADRVLLLAGECEEKVGRYERARSCYQALVTDYPGSPLVGAARQKLAQLSRKTAPGATKP